MPRASARTVAATLTAFALGLGACTAGPPHAPPASGAAALRPDPRAEAAPLLRDVLARIGEEGSARSTVQGNLGLVGELTGESVTRYQAPDADVKLSGHTSSKNQPRNRVEVAIIDGTGYLKSSLVPAEPGKPWLKITPQGEDVTAKLLSPALAQLQDSTDPRATFSGIEPATKIESSAPETINGVPATRYDLRVLTERAAHITQDPSQRTRLQRAADDGIPELGYRLWIDQSGLPVRFAANEEVSQAGQVSLTSTYRDWGVPAELRAPPAEQVGRMGDLPMPQAQPPG